jgi:hypothetical protein
MIAPSPLEAILAQASAPRPRPHHDLPAHGADGLVTMEATVLIRFARAGDARAVAELEQLESRDLPDGPRLVAEVGEQIVAAVAVADGAAVADPFRPTQATVELLRLRARQLRIAGVPRPAPLRRVTARLGLAR